MALVETIRGPVDVASLGTTLMHEHVFVLNEEIRQNCPGYWDEDVRVADAAARLTRAKQRGIDTIADPTVIGLGRDIGRILRVAALTGINIIVATGLYTFRDVPFFFRYRGRRSGAGGGDPMTEMFVADITDGIAGTGVKAAFLKCAIDAEGLTRGVERVLRAVAQAHVATGAPVTVHTHPASRSGLVALGVLREEGADLTRVVIGHSGDTGDLDYLAEVADAGCLLGMDRFGDVDPLSSGQRVKTVAGMCERGYAGSMVLSHDQPRRNSTRSSPQAAEAGGQPGLAATIWVSMSWVKRWHERGALELISSPILAESSRDQPASYATRRSARPSPAVPTRGRFQ